MMVILGCIVCFASHILDAHLNQIIFAILIIDVLLQDKGEGHAGSSKMSDSLNITGSSDVKSELDAAFSPESSPSTKSIKTSKPSVKKKPKVWTSVNGSLSID